MAISGARDQVSGEEEKTMPEDTDILITPLADCMAKRCEIARKLGAARVHINEALGFVNYIEEGSCGRRNIASYWAKCALERALVELVP
jgi:hypothetical protein